MSTNSSNAKMQNVNQLPPSGRHVLGRALTWTGLFISAVGLIGTVSMICLLFVGVLDVPWDGGGGVLLGAASLCLLAVIGFVVSLTALCVHLDLWATLALILSVLVGFLCILNIAFVVLLGMAANPV